MEWLVELDEHERFIRATQWDEFSLEQQAHFLSDIVTSPYFHPGLGILIDYRELKVSNLTGGDLTAISVILQSVKKRIAESKIALLCEGDVLCELGREFGTLLEPKLDNNVVVFQDEKTAIGWLTEENTN